VVSKTWSGIIFVHVATCVHVLAASCPLQRNFLLATVGFGSFAVGFGSFAVGFGSFAHFERNLQICLKCFELCVGLIRTHCTVSAQTVIHGSAKTEHPTLPHRAQVKKLAQLPLLGLSSETAHFFFEYCRLGTVARLGLAKANITTANAHVVGTGPTCGAEKELTKDSVTSRQTLLFCGYALPTTYATSSLPGGVNLHAHNLNCRNGKRRKTCALMAASAHSSTTANAIVLSCK
jgi:hypothetical protein